MVASFYVVITSVSMGETPCRIGYKVIKDLLIHDNHKILLLRKEQKQTTLIRYVLREKKYQIPLSALITSKI